MAGAMIARLNAAAGLSPSTSDQAQPSATRQQGSLAARASDMMARAAAASSDAGFGARVSALAASGEMRASTNVEDDRDAAKEVGPAMALAQRFGFGILRRDPSYDPSGDRFEAADRLTRPLHTLLMNWGDNGNPLAAAAGVNSIRTAAAAIAAAMRQQEQDAVAETPIAAPY